MSRGVKGVNAYITIHVRLFRTRGSAKNFECIECGGPAHEWSYDGGDPDERSGRPGYTSPALYSTSMDYYSPRCRHCHRMRDPNHWRTRTHCKYGHEYTEENTHWNSDGTRKCLACLERRAARRKAARIAARAAA